MNRILLLLVIVATGFGLASCQTAKSAGGDSCCADGPSGASCCAEPGKGHKH